MKSKDARARSASQRVSNRARERGLARNDALTAYTAELGGRKWTLRWAVMHREKAVVVPTKLAEALLVFEAFVRPLVAALAGGVTPGSWEPGGPWTATHHRSD